MPRRLRREAAEHDLREIAGRGGDFRRHGADRDARGAFRREAVDAGRDRRKRDRREAVVGRQHQRGGVAGGEQAFLVARAAVPDRSDRMDHVPGLEPVSAGDLGRPGVAAAERPAFRQQLRPGRAMDRAVDPAAAEQRRVRRIHDGVDVERRDVGDADVEPRRSDRGGEERGAHAPHSRAFPPPAPSWARCRERGKSSCSSDILGRRRRRSSHCGAASAWRSIVLLRPISTKCSSRKRRAAAWPSWRSRSKNS